MTNKEIVNGIMDHIHKVTEDLDKDDRVEILESLWFEIEDERSQCCWNEES